MKKILGAILIIIIVVAYLGMFQINEVEQGVVIRMGDPVREITKPGLKFKIPFIDNVVIFDKRLLEYDSAPKGIITRDKKNIVVDNYARWQIIDPLLFLQTVHSEAGAQSRLDDIIYSELRERIGRHDLTDIVSKERDKITKEATTASNRAAKKFGIKIVDIRIKRADLPKENEANVYKRMETERAQQAKKYRAEGQEKAMEIRSTANKDRTVILAEAYKKSKIIRGEGDAEALKIYADAYNQDKEFYKFTRTLDAYKKILKGSGKNKVILSSDSELWKYLEGK